MGKKSNVKIDGQREVLGASVPRERNCSLWRARGNKQREVGQVRANMFCASGKGKQMSTEFAQANGVLTNCENLLLLIWLGKTRGSCINSAGPQDLGHNSASPYSSSS